jgi:catechol 2,3-dioxygenase-like lactoylglutathione lyase family enzyme
MNIIPLVHCSVAQKSLQFYTEVLDFKVVFSDGESDPSFNILQRGDGFIHLSSHSGDGRAGNSFSVIVSNIDDLFDSLVSRGLANKKPNSPVHQSPLDQTWGTRELYVDDPDGNTIRFIQYKE